MKCSAKCVQRPERVCEVRNYLYFLEETGNFVKYPKGWKNVKIYILFSNIKMQIKNQSY